MNRGVPPTALNARTGEFTPPGRDGAGPLEQARADGGGVGAGHRVIVAERRSPDRSARRADCGHAVHGLDRTYAASRYRVTSGGTAS